MPWTVIDPRQSIQEAIMQAVITVTGKDGVGIVAKVSTECAKYGINIIDISQSVLKDYFAMISSALLVFMPAAILVLLFMYFLIWIFFMR